MAKITIDSDKFARLIRGLLSEENGISNSNHQRLLNVIFSADKSEADMFQPLVSRTEGADRRTYYYSDDERYLAEDDTDEDATFLGKNSYSNCRHADIYRKAKE